MTCVIAIKKNKKIYMGADGLVCGGSKCLSRKFNKIFRLGPMTIGIAGALALGQLVQTKIDVTGYENERADKLLELFIKDIGDLSSLYGLENAGLSLLVALHHQIYYVTHDLVVLRSEIPEIAMGSGEEYAMGSLMSTRKLDMTPEARIKEAIKVASMFELSVGALNKIVVSE